MKNKQPLLSICIPTWNRSKYLKLSLESFKEQLKTINSEEIELFVSDNCSEDDTPLVVQSFIDAGLPITYNRNEENIGAAGNFIKCMRWAAGKYIYLLGDDDLLKPNAVKYILDLIRDKDYGVIHLSVLNKKEGLPEIQEFDNSEDFFRAVSFWITFMSGCVFLKEAVAMVKDCERYKPTHLLQMPFYITSATLRKKNLFVRKSLMENGLDSSSNGGFNFYQVFVDSYLSIWTEFVLAKKIGIGCYESLKKDIYVRFLEKFNYTLLIRKRDVAAEDAKFVGNRKGYKIKNGWKILRKHYGKCSYFYMSFFKYPWWGVLGLMRRLKKDEY